VSGSCGVARSANRWSHQRYTHSSKPNQSDRTQTKLAAIGFHPISSIGVAKPGLSNQIFL
jgi:hypothetical protein